MIYYIKCICYNGISQRDTQTHTDTHTHTRTHTHTHTNYIYIQYMIYSVCKTMTKYKSNEEKNAIREYFMSKTFGMQ